MKRRHHLPFGIKGQFIEETVFAAHTVRVDRKCGGPLEKGLFHRIDAVVAQGKTGKQFLLGIHRVFLGYGHTVFRKRPGFVGADDRGAAERFDSWKPTYDRFSFCHALDTEREHDRDKCGQTFRDCGYAEAYGSHKHGKDGLFV